MADPRHRLAAAVSEQLLVHCGRELGCPVLGDFRRGFSPARLARPSEEQQRRQQPGGPEQEEGVEARALLRELYGARPGQAGGGPLFLHMRALRVRRGRKQPVEAVAALPGHMRELLAALRWGKQGRA
jgi:hypothetical protein